MTLKLSSYLLPKFSRVPFTIVQLIPLISTMVNGTLLNFGKRYEDDFRVIFEQWPKLHIGLDALSNQKLLKGVYYSSKDRWSQICKEKMYIDKKRFHFEWYSCLFGAVPTFFLSDGVSLTVAPVTIWWYWAPGKWGVERRDQTKMVGQRQRRLPLLTT